MKMNKKLITALFVVGFAMALATLSCAAPLKARLTRLKGTVSIQTAGKDWITAKEGTTVTKGDSVKCGKDSSVFITWGDNALKLDALSMFTFEDFDAEDSASKTTLNLTDGKIFSKVARLNKQSNFSVKTPTAHAGVRGTAFEVTTQRFSVLEGTIAATALDNEVLIEAGNYVDISSAGIIGQVTNISDSMLQSMTRDNEECKDIITEQTTIQESNTTIKDVAETTTNIIPQTTQLPELLPGHGGLQLNVDVSE